MSPVKVVIIPDRRMSKKIATLEIMREGQTKPHKKPSIINSSPKTLIISLPFTSFQFRIFLIELSINKFQISDNL